MSAKKTTTTGGRLTAEQREKWAGIIKAADERKRRADFATSFAKMLAGRVRRKSGPGRVTNWGQYAVVLRQAEKQLEKSARENNLLAPGSIDFIAEYESDIADGISAVDIAANYAGRVENVRKYLALSFELFKSHAAAVKMDPKRADGLPKKKSEDATRIEAVLARVTSIDDKLFEIARDRWTNSGEKTSHLLSNEAKKRIAEHAEVAMRERFNGGILLKVTDLVDATKKRCAKDRELDGCTLPRGDTWRRIYCGPIHRKYTSMMKRKK